ncbi:MAG: hypothetical protein K9G49_07880 [Taibaiella sp.]|nr:hypothetical protein [Taibaiella sp.]
MKRLIIFFFLLLPFFGIAQQNFGKKAVQINKDSLERHLSFPIEDNWLFREADSPGMASPDYNDDGWDVVNSQLYLQDDNKKPYYQFNSVGWFRYHFIADSSIVDVPLGLAIEQLGASEIYLDGENITTFGKIAGKNNSVYYNPQSIPFVFIIRDSGHHVLAVRYANYKAQKNEEVLNENFAGFRIEIGFPKNLITPVVNRTMAISFLLSLLCGIFLALAVSHLFMFLYNKVLKSNLYFSTFCISLAGFFIVPWLYSTVRNPAVQLFDHYTLPIITSAVSISLSGFVNELFSKSKKRFWAIATLGALMPFVFFVNSEIGLTGFFLVVGVVMLEAIVLIIWAIVRKIKGAWIIASGMLLFTLLIFFSTVYVTINGDINFGGDNIWESVLLLLAFLAIISLPVFMSLYLAWNFADINKQLAQNLKQVRDLSDKTIQQELEKNKIIAGQKEMLETEVANRTAEVVAQKEKIEKQHDELIIEKEKSDNLLLNILPEEVAEELKEKGYSEARLFSNVSVLFTDFVDFTGAAERMSAQELVDELHICFKTFDEIISKYKIEKIKTIGDAYLAVGGLPLTDADHAVNAVKAALDMLLFMKARKRELGDRSFHVRIGIHSGSVVAGIVGIKKFAYDIWGDTVNTAARMEQSSEAGKINLSEDTYKLVKDTFKCTFRGKIEAKNKGDLNMYYVEDIV